MQPNASELNKFGWFTFKPFIILSILEEIDQGDILLYLDVNDKPLYGIKSYLEKFFVENNAIDILVILGNYHNINLLSKFHRSNLSNELLLSSLFNFQPEAGVIAIKNSPKAISKAIKCINGSLKNENGFDTEIEEFGKCFQTDDFIEGTTAFLEKRKPKYN